MGFHAECGKGWSARCANARSRTCRCKCGGANHGKLVGGSQTPLLEVEGSTDDEQPAPVKSFRLFHYVGDRVPGGAGPGVVTFVDMADDRRPQALPPRNDVRNHSPDGFNWGYGGSGPAQLALALCIHALGGDEQRALRVYQEVKFALVARFADAWSIDSAELLKTIEEIEAARTTK